MRPVIAYGVSSWWHIIWYLMVYYLKDKDWLNQRTDELPLRENGSVDVDHVWKDGFSFKDL